MSRAAPIADWKTQVLARADQLWATHGQSRWQGLNARERLLVSVFFGLFGIWLFVSIAIIMWVLGVYWRSKYNKIAQVK